MHVYLRHRGSALFIKPQDRNWKEVLSRIPDKFVIESSNQEREALIYNGWCADVNYLYKCWTCTEFCEAFTFPMENMCAFEAMVYQQILGIPMGTNCAPIIVYCLLSYERDYMSNLNKCKQYELKENLTILTSRYIDDIFTINNTKFENHIPDIYRAELQLNKANTSDFLSSIPSG